MRALLPRVRRDPAALHRVERAHRSTQYALRDHPRAAREAHRGSRGANTLHLRARDGDREAHARRHRRRDPRRGDDANAAGARGGRGLLRAHAQQGRPSRRGRRARRRHPRRRAGRSAGRCHLAGRHRSQPRHRDGRRSLRRAHPGEHPRALSRAQPLHHLAR